MKDSIVRDWDSGDLLVVYHGTNIDFTEFDDRYLGEETDHPTSRLGFWYKTEKEAIEDNYSIVKECNLNITAPVDISLKDLLLMDEEELVHDKGEWLENGHDGLRVFDTEYGGYSYVVFEINQIRILR